MLQRAAENVSDDLHIAMRMHAKATTAANRIVVDHTQRTKAHLRRIIIIGKRKRVVLVEPAVVGMAAFR